LSNKALKL